MKTTEEAARRIFGERASRYTTSATHTDPQVLGRVVELSRPEASWRALDVGTGTGHTAFAVAPHVARVVGRAGEDGDGLDPGVEDELLEGVEGLGALVDALEMRAAVVEEVAHGLDRAVGVEMHLEGGA